MILMMFCSFFVLLIIVRHQFLKVQFTWMFIYLVVSLWSHSVYLLFLRSLGVELSYFSSCSSCICFAIAIRVSVAGGIIFDPFSSSTINDTASCSCSVRYIIVVPVSVVGGLFSVVLSLRLPMSLLISSLKDLADLSVSNIENLV